MKEFTFLLSAGHDEYTLPDQEGLTLLWSYEDVESLGDDTPAEVLQQKFRDKTGQEPGDWDLWWEAIYQVDMDRPQLEAALKFLIEEELTQDPGGDDGTFDYWPSGVRMALQIAEHLGGGWTARVAGFARSWIMENRAEFKDELFGSLGFE